MRNQRGLLISPYLLFSTLDETSDIFLQSLSGVQQTGDAEVGKQLVALRDHLLTLGTTEAKIDALRDKGLCLAVANRSQPDQKKQPSVIEILQVREYVVD